MLLIPKMIPTIYNDSASCFVGDLKTPRLRNKIVIVIHFLTSAFSWFITSLRRLLPTGKEIPVPKSEIENCPPPHISPSTGVKIDLGCGPYKKSGFIGIDNFCGEVAWGDSRGASQISPVISPEAYLF